MIYINRIILFLFFRALAGHMFDWNECCRSVQCLLLIHLILDLQDHPSYKKSCSTVLHIYWTWISFHTLSLSFNLSQESTSLDAWSPPFLMANSSNWSRSWVRDVTTTASVEVTGLWGWWCCLSGRGHQGWEDVRFSSAFLIIHYVQIGCNNAPESNMEPEDDPFEKGNHLPNLNSQVPFFLMGSVCLYICNVCTYTSRLCCRL